MKSFFYFFFTGISLFVFISMCSSCGRKETEIPKGVLTKQELVVVLTDIHLAQAVVGMNRFNDSIRYDLNEYANSIFKVHHITKAQYDSSLSFYTAHPDLLDEVYQEVINELSKKQSEVSAK